MNYAECRRLYGSGSFILVLLLSFIVVCGCLPFQKSKRNMGNKSYGDVKKQTDSPMREEPKQLITDCRDMRDDEIVSSVWMKPVFKVSQCRAIDVAPLVNYSMFKYPWAEERIDGALKKLFSSLGNKENGSIDVEVMSAIIDMKPKKKLTSRLIIFEEDYTYIEMQLVLVEKGSKEVLCKLSHGKRREDFRDAVDGMIKDIELFFLKDVPKKQKENK